MKVLCSDFRRFTVFSGKDVAPRQGTYVKRPRKPQVLQLKVKIMGESSVYGVKRFSRSEKIVLRGLKTTEGLTRAGTVWRIYLFTYLFIMFLRTDKVGLGVYNTTDVFNVYREDQV